LEVVRCVILKVDRERALGFDGFNVLKIGPDIEQ
jgi:hypothetical protein